ncbi:MAG: rod shape-determining protein RodA [Patescibacteria group bacterium]|nr:rod shape-determining protein RodA [Patescibacteria group bacterium]
MWRFLIPTFLLLVFGLFNLAGIKPYLLQSQVIYAVVALGVFLLIKKIGIVFFRINTPVWYAIFFILLLLTLFVGEDINGSRRWINLFFFNFQPSEFFKVFAILIISDFLAKNQRILKEFPVFLAIVASFTIPAILIFLQPDLETAVMISAIFLTIALFSEVPKKYIITLIVIAVLMIPLAWPFLADYQKNRVLSFIDPSVDPTGTSYNMTQSIITVGSGQLTGRGLGLGKQSTLFFLPENHTDFAFASLVEQFGFIGGLTVITLYLLFALVLIRTIVMNMGKKGEHNRFQYFFATGFFVYFIFQVFINIGMNLGLLPVSGTALPLISYGGSSLVTWMIGLAFLTEQS